MQIENISIFTDTHFVVCHISRFRISVNNEEKVVVAFNFLSYRALACDVDLERRRPPLWRERAYRRLSVCIQARAVNSDVFILISLWGAELQGEARARQEHCHDNTNTNTNNGTFDTCSVLLLSLWLYQHAAHSHTHSNRASESKQAAHLLISTAGQKLYPRGRTTFLHYSTAPKQRTRSGCKVCKLVLTTQPDLFDYFSLSLFRPCFYYDCVLTRKILTNLALNK
jgi:hypothetical protein